MNLESEMKVIGFFAICVMMLWPTILALLFFVDSSGKYNIGGVPNSWLKRVGSVAACLFVGYLWFRVYQLAPIQIEMKP